MNVEFLKISVTIRRKKSPQVSRRRSWICARAELADFWVLALLCRGELIRQQLGAPTCGATGVGAVHGLANTGPRFSRRPSTAVSVSRKCRPWPFATDL